MQLSPDLEEYPKLFNEIDLEVNTEMSRAFTAYFALLMMEVSPLSTPTADAVEEWLQNGEGK